MWLDACVLHQWTIFLSSWAFNLLSVVAKKPLLLWHAVPWSLDICSTQRSPVHRMGMHSISIETPICTCRTKTHQFIWRQQHKCGALGGSPMAWGAVGELKDSVLLSLTLAPTLPEWLLQEQCESALTASAPVPDVPAPACTNGVRPFPRLVLRRVAAPTDYAT